MQSWGFEINSIMNEKEQFIFIFDAYVKVSSFIFEWFLMIVFLHTYECLKQKQRIQNNLKNNTINLFMLKNYQNRQKYESDSSDDDDNMRPPTSLLANNRRKNFTDDQEKRQKKKYKQQMKKISDEILPNYIDCVYFR